MSLLAVQLQGTRVHAHLGGLQVRRGQEIVLERPLHEVSELLLFGDVELSVSAREALLSSGVDTAFLSAKGRYRGRLLPPTPGQGARRQAQYLHLGEPARGLDFAQRIVAAKIHNQRLLLLRLRRAQGEGVSRAVLGSLAALKQTATETTDYDTLRGLEGYAARMYFRGFGEAVLNPAFTFEGRNRRPPLDAANALLSFGYTLLTNRVESHVRRVGLDPYLGALHVAEGTRPSLVLDLVEPFRPHLDRLVLRLVNRRQLGPEDFEVVRPKEDGPLGTYLGPTARPLFIRSFAGLMRGTRSVDGRQLSLDQLIEAQVRRAAALFEGRVDRYETHELE